MNELALPGQGDASAVMRRHARSFAWAAAVLPRATAADVATLYAFCRTVDDVADTRPADPAARVLEGITAALDGRRGASGPVADFLELAARRDLPLAPARTLVSGVHDDLQAPRIATPSALIRYCYRVAGTVGLLMCPLIGVRDRDALPFAVDLGIAMQLTNIARDVAEDAAHGRRYLPAEWVGEELTPARIAAGHADVRASVYAGVRDVLALADRYYTSADRAMSAIPLAPRGGILVARHVYAGIGTRIRAAGPDGYARGRAMLSMPRKIAPTARAACALAAGLRRPVAEHDPGLHRAIAGFPGADPRAAPEGER